MRIHCGKRGTALLLALALCLPLTGCGGKDPPAPSAPGPESSAEADQPKASKAPAAETPVAETPAPDQRAAAREAYLAFLNGTGAVTTGEAFRQEDNYLCPDYGTYSYEELKYATSDEMMGNGSPRYTFLDLGGDGEAELLVLRFENEDPSFLNWTGIICYEDGALTLTYSYVDGYRVVAELFTSGFLRIGGSGGAGEYDEDGLLVEKDGTARALYESCTYWGSFAPNIQYQLKEPKGEPMWGKYYDLDLTYCVETYSDGTGLWAFAEYTGPTAPEDRDPEALALEEDFLNELTEQGVRVVDWETFTGLYAPISPYYTQLVTWTDFDDGLPSPAG